MSDADAATSPVTAGEPVSAMTTRGQRAAGPDRPATAWWKEAILLVVVAIVLAIIIKTFFVQAFWIPSGSMENTLRINDRILVEKPSYWFGTPERGDIIVFKDPDHWLTPAESGGPSNPFTDALAFIGLYPTGGHLVK
ncbi:MAG: signal peptidase I, partial [Sciscionella sp.]